MESSAQLKTYIRYLLSTLVLIVSGVVFATLGVERLPYRLGTFPGGVVCVACLISAFTDFTTCKILNVVTYPAFTILVVFLLLEGVLPESWIKDSNGGYLVSPTSSVLGGIFCFIALFIPWLLSSGGAGDAKLAAVLGVGLGLTDGFIAVGAAFIFAFASLLYRVAVYVVKEATRPLWSRFVKSPEREQEGSENTSETAPEEGAKHKIWVPMGVAFLFGTVGSASGLWRFLMDSLARVGA